MVIAVISTIAAFSVGQYSNVTGEARIVKAKTELKTVQDATVQYLYKTEHIPVNSTGIGVTKSEFKLADNEYAVLNLDLLAKKQLLPSGKEVSACLTSIPTSSKYTKPGIKNDKKQEPSFIYVIDNNLNVYLAEAEKDVDTDYFIHTKIYETKNADIYDSKVKMSYEGNKPVLEEVSNQDDTIKEDSTTVKENIQINPEISNIPNGEGNSGIENKFNNSLYYKNLSVAGFTVFLDAYNIDLSKIKSIEMEITAGTNKNTKTLYAVKSTRWFGRVDAKDLNNYSGNYKCSVYAVTKESEKVNIEEFTVLIDRTKPTVSIQKSTDGFYSESPININITASDKALSSGIKRIEYKINDGNWKEYTAPFVVSEPDYYEIQAIAIDNFENESDITTTTINDYTKPEVYLSKTTNGISINLGVDVADEDILWKNGFETTDKSVSINQNSTPKYGVSGGQALVTNQSFEGLRSYRLLKNDDGNGNWYQYPNTSSNTSRLNLGSLTKTVSNNMYLSLVYRYKSYGNSNIRPHLDGGRGRKIRYYNCTVIENVAVGSKTIKLDSVTGLSLNGFVTTATNDYDMTNYLYIREIDTVNKTIVLSGGVSRELKAGEKLAYRHWRGGGSFTGNATGDTNGEWRLFTSVMKTTNYDDYDLYEHGTGSFLFQNTASNELYIDNIKMGYASRMILYKNGTRFNTTSQEYTTSYTDNNVPDKAKPTIDNIKINNTQNNYNIEIKSSDKGTKYDYYMESISRSGKVTTSKTRSYTVTSGIKQYYYVIDNNPSTTVSSTSQKTEDSVINISLDKNKSWYIHIIAEDTSGNKSDVYHKQIA